jgi:hypothetical protein
LIVVAFKQAQLGSWTNAAVFQKLEQAAVAFVDSADRVGAIEFGICQQDQAATAAADWPLDFA